jgi:hypothetical protein
VVGGVLGTGEDVMPSGKGVSKEGRRGCEQGRDGGTYSRMFDSEGCATMYGGGFSEIVLYSRVSCS